jgi:hypothetical protein
MNQHQCRLVIKRKKLNLDSFKLRNLVNCETSWFFAGQPNCQWSKFIISPKLYFRLFPWQLSNIINFTKNFSSWEISFNPANYWPKDNSETLKSQNELLNEIGRELLTIQCFQAQLSCMKMWENILLSKTLFVKIFFRFESLKNH